MRKQEQQEVKIPALSKKVVSLTIEGMSPLMTNKFSEEAQKSIEDKQTGVAKAKKAPKDPKKCYEQAMYKLSNGKPAIPAAAFKKAAVGACRFLDEFKMTEVRGAFHILADEGDLIQIKGIPQMDVRKVNVKGSADIRYRPRFDNWECTFKVMYNSNFITPGQIANLFENAGFGIGIGELRPEKGGSLGMFRVKSN